MQLEEWSKWLKKYKLVADSHSIENAVSINVMARCRASEGKEQLRGSFYKLYKYLINVLYT